MKLIEKWCLHNITNNRLSCDFVISNLEIASNKESLLLDLTKKNILKIDLFIMFGTFLTKIMLLKVYQICVCDISGWIVFW
jgi:hypothetical protein